MLQSDDERMGATLEKLRVEADAALAQSPVSVTDKECTPPSGDQRDYMSLGPYWWPNPDTPDGLPYVRRDGEQNPESKDTDRARLETVIFSTEALALGCFFLGEEKYARHAVELLRVFFLDEQRGMRPNLNFGQGIPGICDGRGIGIIDTWTLAEPMVDTLLLLEDAGALSPDDQTGLRQWFDAYLDWLLTSSHGQKEAQEHNNHGTAYDLQVAALALYVGREDLARETLNAVAERRLVVHIEPDGSQPHELARTRALDYSTFNLFMLTSLAEIGERCGVDLWRFGQDGRSLRAGIDYLIPFWTQAKPFTYQQITPFKPLKADQLLRRAASAYQEPEYQHVADQLAFPEDVSAPYQSRLLYPPLS